MLAAPAIGLDPAPGAAEHVAAAGDDDGSALDHGQATGTHRAGLAGERSRAAGRPGRGWLGRIAAPWRAPWPVGRLWGFWAATRLLLLALVWAGHPLGAQQGVLGDVRLYAGWGTAFLHGHGLPVGDQKWQYPPGAILVFAIPALAQVLVRLPYRAGFPLFMLAVDAAVTAALGRARGPAAGSLPAGPANSRTSGDPAEKPAPGHREPPGPGARVWLVGTTLLGPVTLARFDLVPAACAVAGLLLIVPAGRRAAGRRAAGVAGPRFGAAGFAAAVGVLVKAWPAFLLIALGRSALAGEAPVGASPWRRLWSRPLVRAAVGAAAAALVTGLLLVAAGAGGDLLGFLGAQRARGLQLEAVPATVFVVIRMFGVGETAHYEYGSLQFGDPAARTVATACSLVEIAVVAVVASRWWLTRPGPAPARGLALTTGDRLLALLLVVLVTSRVLSPQYLVWVLAVAAAVVALGATEPPDGDLVADPAEARRGADRRAALAMLLVVAAISQVIYPWRYNDIIEGRPVTSLVLVARNILLLAACWRAVRVIAWRPAGRRPAGRARTDPAAASDPPG
ncbi:hypothetical protein [Pseudofrankia sp. DC12]|uniref:hypothetical protein n=1 Tax=Pseudofrankia sp. DC12 TaxID=683315 RepID=UPI0005F7FE94|nr:hypothetical protein [Pseudofrankia sp. DC12]